VAPIDRLVQQKDEFGSSKGVIKRVVFPSPSVCVLTSCRPFVIDLESTNGTHVNGEIIPTSRYYELKARDSAFRDVAITRV
jgi:smad nuclear-interacting protein 1